jgi:uncharacterized phage infection (PIP) family protein YhgE
MLPSIVKVKKYEPMKEGDMVPHISSELAQAYVRNGFIAQQGDSIDSIIASVNALLLNLQQENNPEAGSLFRILDRVAKITDHLLSVSEALGNSSILPEAEKAMKEGKNWVDKLPETTTKINDILVSTNAMIQQAEKMLASYSEPNKLVSQVTDGQVPVILKNLNQSVSILQNMLNDVHGQREQLAITVSEVQEVLDKLNKTLEGLNNNPLLKDGIQIEPENTGIEMHE